MDNITFNELLKEGEIDLILMDGPQALTKKQLSIINKTVESVGRNVPETMKKKATFNPMKMVEMLGAGTEGVFNRMMGKPLDKDKSKLKRPSITVAKSDKINKVFYTTISESKNVSIRKNDTVANILAKMFNFMKKVHYDKIKQNEIDKDFEKEELYESIREKQKQLKVESKPTKATLTKKEGFDFSKLFKFLGIMGLLFAANEAQAKLEEFVDKIKEIKQKIRDKFTKIENYLRDIDILGYKPFENVFGPKKEITNAGPLAELVRQYEGGKAEYDALVIPPGGIPKEFQDYKPSEMTLSEVLKLQDKMIASKKFPSSAVGGYQIIKSTLLGAIDFLDLDLNTKYDKNTQDKIFNEYLITQKQRKVGQYLRGESGSSLEEAQMGLAKEFSSFPSPKDTTTSSGRSIKKGESFYKGVGNNAASVSLEASASSLNQTKSLQENKTAQSVSVPKLNLTPKSSVSEQPPLTNIPQLEPIPKMKDNGEKLSGIFKKNDELKDEMLASVVIINNSTTNNIINKKQNQTILSIPSSLELPYIIEGMA
jgi:hypothetical protein